MPEQIIINEVGPRDGLQNQQRLVPTDQKLTLINALLAAGITHMEATSFVSPKSVPQMADAPDLLARLPGKDRIDYSVLVPNVRGYERAVTAGARAVTVVLGATESMNRRNINMSFAQAADVSAEVLARARRDGLAARAYIAVAFVCPFEGPTDPGQVRSLTAGLFEAGAQEVIIADTIGHANPEAVARLFEALVAIHGACRLSGHFHDTQGLALVNCWAAAERGIRKFDASIGGLGGCPFAPGAAGNVATEDVVHLFEEAGFETGIDIERLVEAVDVAEAMLAARLGGRWLQWYRSRKHQHVPVGDSTRDRPAASPDKGY